MTRSGRNRLDYLAKGSANKEVLIFLHGLMTCKEVWRLQLDEFATSYRTIAIDLAGFGASRQHKTAGSYDEHAHNLASLLKDLEIEKVHLVGWSMGASVAISFAHFFPPLLSTLTLVSCNPKVLSSDDFPFGISADAARTMADKMCSNLSDTANLLASQMLEESSAETFHDEVSGIISREDSAIGAHHLQIAIDTDLRGNLPSISVPTLVCYGEKDPFSPRAVNDYIVSQLQNAHLVKLPLVAHWPFLTDPKGFNQVLGQFLNSNRQ